ncbi:CHAT domain-containing protein [Micromonospora sp. WMMD558]|uniref:CHAT domain-containing protein n=1 Tax=Micromonospora sp. WMMD558 TaxID=3403462 RepID=UPI003BF4FE57
MSEPSLDDWIAHLTALVSDPPPDADVAQLTAMLGQAYLERYELDPDDDVLSAAIANLDSALAAVPEHDQTVNWLWALGTAYAERARLTDARADHERAVSHLTAAYQGRPPDDPERDVVAVELLETIWDRLRSRWLDDGRTPQAAAADAHEAVTAMEAVQVNPAATDLAAYAQLLLGMGLLARYDDGGEREPDLDRGVAALSAALDQLTPDTTPYFAVASADLAAAYLEVAGLRKDRAYVQLAVRSAERALAACGPDQPGWLRLHHSQATAYTALWDLDEDPADFARAIACWRTIRDHDPDPSILVSLAELLHSGAIRTDDPAGLPEAIALFEQALSPTEDPGPVWRQLGEVHRLNWQLARAPGSLDAAARCLDQALAIGGTAEDILAAHAARVVVANEALEHDVARDDSSATSSLRQLRHALDEADGALDDDHAATAHQRGVLAAVLVYAEFSHFGEAADHVDLPRLRHLLAVGRAIGDDPPPGFAGLLDAAEGILEQYADSSTASRDSDGITALLRAGKDETFAKAHGDRLRAILPFALQARAAGTGDLRGYRAARALAGDLAVNSGDKGPAAALVAESAVLSAAMEAARLGSEGDLDGMREARDRMLALWRRLGPSRNRARVLGPVVQACQDIAAVITGEGQVRPQPPPPLPAGPLTHLTLATAVVTGTTQVAAAVRRGDLLLLRRWADHLAKLAGRLEPGHTVRLAALTLAARAELAQAIGLGDRAAAARAARLMGEAATESGGPEHPLWTGMIRDQAQALRRAGDPDRARTRRLGLAALHGHARKVLLQAGTDHAMDTAREATADATTVVRWCLQDQADEDLVTALDAGRGLVLHAATASRTVVDLLRDAGRPDLAEEWRQTAGLGRDQITGDVLGAVLSAGEVPDDLRPRVLRALESAGVAIEGPLAQVRVGEIREALTELEVDALVYLVPAAEPVPGLAVVVPAAGEIDVVELPDLVVGDNSPVQKLLHAALGRGVTGRGRDAGERDAGPVGGAAAPLAGARIDDLCRWAWRAAMAQLVAETGAMRTTRPARLVLIPMGVLGLVPWHAAYRNTPSGRRYAVHDLIISYSPSARMLCAAAARPARPVRSALVVGDPLGDLPFAGVEARAIHQRFHPDGRYLGGPAEGPDGIAHPDNVLEWIRAVQSGPSLLHLACHGRVDPTRPADSHLMLSGGQLPARQLLEVSRIAALELGQVFLAACTTNLTGGNHDEAFSLATAFLAAGAHTVFGSLWSVPDVGTSLLMYLVHHFVYEEGCPPAEALHRAQLWMLDPDRKPPHGMPAELAAQCGRRDNAEPLAWAAFTHLGR